LKIAVLSDIHGNNYALRSVLDEATKNQVEQLIVLGDIVGYYYNPHLVLDMLSGWKYEMVLGNHENILRNLLTGCVSAEALKKKYGSGHEKAIEKLSKEQILILLSLPENLSLEIHSTRFLLTHGSPWSTDFYLYPDVSVDILEKCKDLIHDFIFVGHSHYQFAVNLGQQTLINVGSVGQSRQKGGVANWVLIDTENKSFQLKATAYNISELIKEIEQYDPDNRYLLDVLHRK
jgi:putative phosphoesterase